ncbi:Gpr1 family protein [Favolaschia claudopus]|uniref:Gpr1 family protein n=1 Tax=Favolaschia claudopus TaxID=2862362 RepID=A0AAW0AA17_9AGAR
MVETTVNVVVDNKVLSAHSVHTPLVGMPGGFSPEFVSCYNKSVFIPLASPAPTWNWALEFDGSCLEWRGTSVALFGVTPPAQYNQTVGIADPSTDTTNLTQPGSYRRYTYPVSSQGGQFFASGTVPDTRQIQIGLSNANGIVVDYALVTAGNFTNLDGQTILVDDSSPEIFWSGSWAVVDNYTLPIQCTIPSPQAFEESKTTLNSTDSVNFMANMQPHANSTHSSSAAGDSFTFQFAGTSILVSGVTPGPSSPSDWLLRMEFSLDGNITTRTLNPTSDPTKPHYVYFEPDPLPPGNHTLVGKIVNVAGSPLPAAQIDYITYMPSFFTITEKPVFPAPEVSGPATSPSSVPPSSDSQSHAKSHAGAIAGGVMGGCLLIGCCLGILWLVRRNKKRNAPNLDTEPFTSTVPTVYSQSDVPPLQQSKRRFSPPPAASSSVASNSNAALSEQQSNIAAEMRQLQNSPVEARLRELQAQMDAIEMRMQENAPPSYSGGG